MDDRAAGLFAEILADPGADAPRAVYADHLADLGDPRGELIHLQLRASDPALAFADRQAMFYRSNDLVGRNTWAWTRELATVPELEPTPWTFRFVRGFVERIELAGAHLGGLAALRRLTPLVGVRITSATPAVVTAVADQLAELSDVKIFGHAPPPIETLAALQARGRLRRLSIGIGDAAAEAVAGCPSLVGLDALGIHNVYSDGVEWLAASAHLAGVTRLKFEDARLTAVGCAALGSWLARGGVRELRMPNGPIDAAGSRALAGGLAAVTRLELTASKLGDATAAIVGAPALEALELRDCEIDPRGLLAIESPRLRQLDLTDCRLADRDLAALAPRIPAIVRLVLHGNFVGEGTARAVGALEALDSLDLSGTGIADDTLVALIEAAPPGLRNLDLSNGRFGPHVLDALGASALGRRLVRLDLSRCPIGDAGLEALLAAGGLDHLVDLEIGNCALTAAGVARLVASPIAARLRTLAIHGLDAPRAEVMLGAQLPELRSLTVDLVDDRAIAVLAANRGLPNLFDLTIFDSMIGDTGAAAFAGMTRDDIASIRLEARALNAPAIARLRARFGHRIAIE